MAPFVGIRNIVKRFPGVVANDHVSLDISAGEVHALLGENGAGKSTLMQILYGFYRADEGEILLDGQPIRFNSPKDAIAEGIGMIHQDFMLVQPFSVVENVVLGLSEGRGPLLDLSSAASRLQQLSDHHGLAVDPLARIEHLSVGVQQRVEILKLLYREVRLLILDEPTAVLTPQEADALIDVLRRLAADGRAVILVTHKLHEVMAVADRVTVMRDGRAIATRMTGETSEAELARLMVGRDVNLRAVKTVHEAGSPELHVHDMHVRDETGRSVVHGVDLDVRAGEILGIAGVDGNGQSHLVEAIVGLRTIEKGRVMVRGFDVTHGSPRVHHERGLAYIPADRRRVGSVAELGIDANAILGTHRHYTRLGGLLQDTARIRACALELIRRFDVRAPGPTFRAGKLSGGNLQKLVLGREVMRGPRVLVVEQPTRGLDVGATETVWAELLRQRAQNAAILLVSAELEEILNLADRIAVIHAGRIMGILDPTMATKETLGLMMAGVQPGAVVCAAAHA